MVVGLGTGRAAARGVRALAARADLDRTAITCVSTSEATTALAAQLGLRVVALPVVSRVDHLFDGADEVSPDGLMIKGGGGAMTRERIVAALCGASGGRCVYMIDAGKLSRRLGERAKLPIEVVPMAAAQVGRALRARGLESDVRRVPGGAEFITDNAGLVLDATLPTGCDVHELAAWLKAMAGVIDHGLFLSECDELLVEQQPLGEVQRRSGPGRVRPAGPVNAATQTM
jgi:ribose 5-phosphate isomerase A